jgi:hypothetical protein
MRGLYQLLFTTVILTVIAGMLIVYTTPIRALSAPVNLDKPAYMVKTIASNSSLELSNWSAVSAVPQIIGITPASASAGTMTEVTISGTGFGNTPGSVNFYRHIAAQAPGYVTSWSDTLIKVIVPPVGTGEIYYLSPSSGPVTVTTAEGATSDGYPFAVTFAWKGARWPGENPVIDFYVNPNTPDCTGEEIAVQNAADAWNAVPDKSFTFRYAGTTTYAGSPDGGNPNGVNDIYWRDIGEGNVAQCYIWGYENEMREIDLIFNAHYPWSTSDNTPSGHNDVQTTALHEFGHWLDLADLFGAAEGYPQDTAKVMFGGVNIIGRNISIDDMAGMQWAYPSSTQSQYTINAAAGIGGNITPSGSVQVDRETDQTFTITPAPGYVIDKVLIDNYTQVTSPSYTFNNIANNHTILATFVASTPTTATFGLNSGNTNFSQLADALQAMRFKNTAGTGTLTQLELLVDDTSPNGKVRMGVYADDNGKPGALLPATGEVNVKNDWVAIKDLNLAVTEGKYYWLAFNLDSQNVIRSQSGQPANSHYWVNGHPYGPLPSTFPSGALINNRQYVMRATVSTSPDQHTLTILTVNLQGGSRSDNGWIIPLTVKFFTPGADVLNEIPLYTFDLTTTKSGSVAFASCTGITPGDYDITVVSPHTLMNVKRDVAVALPEVQIYLGTLLEGDANNDGRINAQDFSLLSASYLQASINPMADFDQNGVVNALDFALLSANYLKLSPIEVY